VTFLSHCENTRLRSRIEAAGHGFIPLEIPHPDPLDLQTTLSVLDSSGIEAPQAAADWVVLDGYHFDSSYQQGVRTAGRRLLVIDDLAHLAHYHADVLLNQNINAERLAYRHDADTVLLLGTPYALLRPEFSVSHDRRRDMPAVARNVLVTMGGADPDNVTLKVIQAMAHPALQNLDVRVVVGPANPHLNSLREELEGSVGNVQLLSHITDMADLMAWADVAISAGGSTCWELACVELPGVVLVLADNQKEIAHVLAEYEAAISLGDASQLDVRDIADTVLRLIHDYSLRSSMSEVGRVLVDGKGASRVVDVLSHGGPHGDNDDLRVRPARPDDVLLIWQWANDPVTRANSFQSDAIPWSTHAEWYRSKLASPETRIWILEYRQVPIAQVRYDRVDPDTAQISYVVSPGYRGRGLGTKLLELSGPLACRGLAVRRLQGITFARNAASARSFTRAGFTRAAERAIAGIDCQVFCRECV
jgi:UDP-2,4-diacetamido-2,4,6-trideoxy-beta-L-altropyranose hydrolase